MTETFQLIKRTPCPCDPAGAVYYPSDEGLDKKVCLRCDNRRYTEERTDADAWLLSALSRLRFELGATDDRAASRMVGLRMEE